MGFIRTKVTLFPSGDGKGPVEIEALVDTGAIMSMIPRQLLATLGVTPTGRGQFRTIEGRPIERDVGVVEMEVQSRHSLSPVPVIFGEEGDTTVLGVTALEIMGLEADPARGELRPTEFLLL